MFADAAGFVLRFGPGVVGMAVLGAGWVVVQRVFMKLDPDQPGVEDRCGSCGGNAGKCEAPRRRRR